MGRTSTYDADTYPELAKQYARDGKTDKQIAKAFDVSEVTLNNWKNQHPLFLESLKEGKHVVDAKVESKLYKRAMGYEYEEITEESLRVGKEETPKVKVRTVTKQMAPDVVAQIFWLKNRKPEEWRDKQDIAHTGNVVIEVELPEQFDGNKSKTKKDSETN